MDYPTVEKLRDWLAALGTCVIPIALAFGPVLASWVMRPKIQLITNVESSGNSIYLRLKVKNIGCRIAKKCVGRLLEIRDEQGETLENYPQLNFCWERHNQMHPPHPVDIPGKRKVPYVAYLDIAKYTTQEPTVIRLRVDAENQQLPQGGYNPQFRELTIPAKTYHVLVSVYTEDGDGETDWYVLRRSENRYSIHKSKPPKRMN